MKTQLSQIQAMLLLILVVQFDPQVESLLSKIAFVAAIIMLILTTLVIPVLNRGIRQLGGEIND